ncbi:MAG: porphobilinogen deaminase [Stictis urceolatum]|nr:porphobilinogen deaminase [Stictis urceolata]
MATDPAFAPSAELEPNPRTTFHIGTRKSALALKQTDVAISYLKRANPSFTFVVDSMQTMGDKNQTTALHQFNAKSLWTTELEEELASHATDMIIHSQKDMPTQLPSGCALGASINREEKRDCVVMGPRSRAAGYTKLADLPEGSVVGTSSVRRLSQLRRMYPKLKTEDVRGNIGTRLGKLDAEDGKFAALILAATGCQRIGYGDRVSSFLSREEGNWLGPVGQGAIGVEIRSDDETVKRLCEGMMADAEGDPPGAGKRVLWEILAERMLLRTLEGGCSVPIGVETEWEGEELIAYAMVASVDGQQQVDGELRRKVQIREDAEIFGLDLAQDLIQKGAGKILEEITLNRKIIEDAGGA